MTAENHCDFLILGGGVAGLSAAAELKKSGASYLVLERNAILGGLTRSIYLGDQIIDYTGHLLHLNRCESPAGLPGFHQKDSDWQVIHKAAKCYFQGELIDAPFQYNISQLSQPEYQKALASFGDAQQKAPSNRETLYDYLRESFGSYIADQFLIPYNEKLFGTDLQSLSLQSIKRFFPPPNREAVLARSTGISTYNSKFWYPRHDGIDLLIKGVSKNTLNCKFNAEILEIDLEQKRLKTCDTAYSYQHLISSIPLPAFCQGTRTPALKDLGKKLTATSTLSVNIVANADVPAKLQGIHWIYVADKSLPFYRVGVYSHFNQNIAKKGYYSLYIEVGENQHQAPLSVKDITQLCIEKVSGLGWLDKDKISHIASHRIAPAYVNFDHQHKETVSQIFSLCHDLGVHFIGRYGTWDYISMEDGIFSGFDAARALL